jgi:lipid II:glycine glycyltransferase (peptidoglycan interpeptide bridge formation enzyme)
VPFTAIVGHGTVVYHGPIVYVDLRKTLAELTADTRENHRRNIRRLESAGFITTIDDWSLYAAFGSLYRATMERVAAATFYFFSDAYFQDIRHMLGRHLHLCAVLAPNGELAAAGLFTETDGIVEYHLGGTAEPYLRHAASKLMFDTIRRWAKGAGCVLLNLGGGIGGHPGPLLNFKAGFSRSLAPFHTVGMVFDTRRYSQLTRLWRERSDCPEAVESYFPIYRQPLKPRPHRILI